MTLNIQWIMGKTLKLSSVLKSKEVYYVKVDLCTIEDKSTLFLLRSVRICRRSEIKQYSFARSVVVSYNTLLII